MAIQIAIMLNTCLIHFVLYKNEYIKTSNIVNIVNKICILTNIVKSALTAVAISKNNMFIGLLLILRSPYMLKNVSTTISCMNDDKIIIKTSVTLMLTSHCSVKKCSFGCFDAISAYIYVFAGFHNNNIVIESFNMFDIN